MGSGLLNTIEKNKDLREIFGKKELDIIKRQLTGIKLTRSEQARLSSDIRKKFRVIRELNKFSDEFELKWRGKRKPRGKAKKKTKTSEKKEEQKSAKAEPAPKPGPKKDIIQEAKEIILKDELSSKVQKIYISENIITVELRGAGSRTSQKFIKRIKEKVDSKLAIQVYGFLRRSEKRIVKKGEIIWEK